MAPKAFKEKMRDVLIGAKKLIEETGWCQETYAIKNGKAFYTFLSSGEIADAYCFVGAIEKIAYDMWKKNEHGIEQGHFNKLAYMAQHLVIDLQGWNGCPADWNDRDETKELMKVFIDELKKKNTPRDKAKVEINKFNQELKTRNIQPTMTKEIVLGAIDKAIELLELQNG